MNIIITLPVLLYAGIFDAKKRIIPDKVSLILLAIGILEIPISLYQNIFYISVSERIVGILIPATVLFLIYMLKKGALGGGDFKLLSSLGFCVGIFYLIEILVFTFVGGLIYCLIKKEKSMPLATFVFIGAAMCCVV